MNEAIKRLYLEYNSPAPRTRTLFLTEADRKRYANFPTLDELQADEPFSVLLDRIYHGDCIEGMSLLPDERIDLIFADPPYNIGKDYGNNQMRLSGQKYRKWSERWIREAIRLLKPTGSIYVCSDWRYSGMTQSLLDNYLIVKNRGSLGFRRAITNFSQ